MASSIGLPGLTHASRSLERPQRRAGWVMVAPAMLHMAVFIAIPTVVAVIFSFTTYDFIGRPQWAGLANYRELFRDDRFHAAVVNTVLYTVVSVPVAMAIALALALALNQRIRFRGFFRAAYYLPQVAATVAVGTIWLWVFNPDTGLANAVLGLIGVRPVHWLTSTTWALPSLMIVGVWQGLGVKMVVYLAGLQNISSELVDAARIDGATRWQVFRNVTWPGLATANFFVLVTSIIFSFQVFDQVYVMTAGGPVYSTTVLTWDIYENAFQRLRMGYASAESVILVLLIAVVTALALAVQRAGSSE